MDQERNSELSRLGRADQGFHEAEVSYDGRIELPRIKDKCAKNPDHTQFICVDDLSLRHLPEKYQKKNILELIKVHAGLTVCLFVNYTSKNRPLKFPGSEEFYPFYSMRGTNATRTGTGSILVIHEYDETNSHAACFCNECKISDNPKRIWGKIIIQTGKHVVFDNEEGENTDIEIFYNNENRDTVYKLHGCVKDTDINSDWCLIYCPTHDMTLVNQLQDMQHSFERLREEIKQQYETQKPDLAVIVSHPHGCCKHITIGKWTIREEIENSVYTRYSYTTATCPGCSGARVWILAEFNESKWACHIHSEGLPSGINRSGLGWY